MKNYCFDLGFMILLFLFSIFALSNICFIFHFGANYFYVFFAFLISEIYLLKTKNNRFLKKYTFDFIFCLGFGFFNVFY